MTTNSFAWTNRPTYAVFAWIGDNLAERASAGSNVTAEYCEHYTRELLQTQETTVEDALIAELLEFTFAAIDWDEVAEQANAVATN